MFWLLPVGAMPPAPCPSLSALFLFHEGTATHFAPVLYVKNFTFGTQWFYKALIKMRV